MRALTNPLPRISRTPFLPEDSNELAGACDEVFRIQVQGLVGRLKAVAEKSQQPVLPVSIGISGGVDSTHGLLVTLAAYRQLGWQRKHIITVTMPGFGTSKETLRSAYALCESLNLELREISIVKAVEQHLRDIGHEPCYECLLCENAQARERTQILMDLGFTIGTGNLSEIAYGWCTYNGDHMSNYNPNSSVPKTFLRAMLEWQYRSEASRELRRVLDGILNAPASPELLRPGADGKIAQKTDDKIGPEDLRDFFIFYSRRYGYGPAKIVFLAEIPYPELSREEIKKWLKIYYERFFANQFKRNAAPDGVLTGSVGFSQRANWRMASDASVSLWLKQLEKV